MKLGDIRIPRGLLGAAILLFFLPFVTVSCGGQQIPLSGTQLLTGTTVNGQWSAPQFDVVFAFLSAIIALAATLLRTKLGRGLTAFFAAVGFGWLQFFKLRFDLAIADAQIPLVVSYGSGFWLACLALVATAAFSVYAIVQRATPAVAPAASAAPISAESVSATPALVASVASAPPTLDADAAPAFDPSNTILLGPAEQAITEGGTSCAACGATLEQPTRFCMSCGARVQPVQ